MQSASIPHPPEPLSVIRGVTLSGKTTQPQENPVKNNPCLSPTHETRVQRRGVMYVGLIYKTWSEDRVRLVRRGRGEA